MQAKKIFKLAVLAFLLGIGGTVVSAQAAYLNFDYLPREITDKPLVAAGVTLTPAYAGGVMLVSEETERLNHNVYAIDVITDPDNNFHQGLTITFDNPVFLVKFSLQSHHARYVVADAKDDAGNLVDRNEFMTLPEFRHPLVFCSKSIKSVVISVKAVPDLGLLLLDNLSFTIPGVGDAAKPGVVVIPLN
jgi:hypothetical protein